MSHEVEIRVEFILTSNVLCFFAGRGKGAFWIIKQ